MKNKNVTVIDKSDVMKCWGCEGKGLITIPQSHPIIRELCPTCQGTGKWVETHYIIVDNKNKIAIDSEFMGK
jgi:DnaJ-class molecular chaperone